MVLKNLPDLSNSESQMDEFGGSLWLSLEPLYDHPHNFSSMACLPRVRLDSSWLAGLIIPHDLPHNIIPWLSLEPVCNLKLLRE